jgi:signal transduction histidine kinase
MATWATRPWAEAHGARPLTRRLGACLDAAMRSWRGEDGDRHRLEQERDALQSVASLVARGATPAAILQAVAETLGSLIDADYAAINRWEIDQTVTIVAFSRAPDVSPIAPPWGHRIRLRDDTPSATVLRTHEPVRRSSNDLGGELGGWLRDVRVGHVVACPVIAEGRQWGTMVALYLGPQPPPPATEEYMTRFVQPLTVAISQAQTRAELIESRARLVTSADTARRGIERDLHDGPQQHLISLALHLRAAETSLPSGSETRGQLSATVEGLTNVVAEIAEISRGLHPPTLARLGLEAALEVLVDRSPVPVQLHFAAGRRFPEEIEVTLYYVVSEALTNVLKHANASTVSVILTHTDSNVRLTIQDDGVGGADPTRGSGMVGLKDRVEALGGNIGFTSLRGKGTSLFVTIPDHPITKGAGIPSPPPGSGVPDPSD